jgi:hypothetical protein
MTALAFLLGRKVVSWAPLIEYANPMKLPQSRPEMFSMFQSRNIAKFLVLVENSRF